MYNFENKTKASEAGKMSKRGKSKDIVDLRDTIKNLVDKNHSKVTKWFDQVAEEHPEKALRLYVSLLEFVLPKIDRVNDHEIIKSEKEKSSVTFIEYVNDYLTKKHGYDKESNEE